MKLFASDGEDWLRISTEDIGYAKLKIDVNDGPTAYISSFPDQPTSLELNKAFCKRNSKTLLQSFIIVVCTPSR